MRTYAQFFFFIFFTPLFSSGADKAPDLKMDRASWASQFSVHFIAQFCSNNPVVQNCLHIPPTICEEDAKSFSIGCGRKSLGASVPLKNSVYLGRRIGRCIGENFEKKYGSQIKDKKCAPLYSYL